MLRIASRIACGIHPSFYALVTAGAVEIPPAFAILAMGTRAIFNQSILVTSINTK
jgi:hypothetical protein